MGLHGLRAVAPLKLPYLLLNHEGVIVSTAFGPWLH